MQASHFPDIDLALDEPNGLLAQGGVLTPELLLDAYRHGIFPWPSGDPDSSADEEAALLWWSPNPRAVLFVDRIYCSKSLKKTLRRSGYHLSLDTAFDQVIDNCASIPRSSCDEEPGTWITPSILSAYKELHQAGHAHSIEVWDADELVGGLYGVVVGRLFCGESMFHRKTDASKVALLALAKYLQNLGWPLIDCQVENPHLASLGSELISRMQFKKYLPAYQEEDELTGHHDKPDYAFTADHWPFGKAEDLLY